MQFWTQFSAQYQPNRSGPNSFNKPKTGPKVRPIQQASSRPNRPAQHLLAFLPREACHPTDPMHARHGLLQTTPMHKCPTKGLASLGPNPLVLRSVTFLHCCTSAHLGAEKDHHRKPRAAALLFSLSKFKRKKAA